MRFSDTENNMTFCIGVCWLGTPNYGVVAENNDELEYY